jgi:hypothetical protein
MKTTIISIISFFSISLAYSQYEYFGVGVRADTVTIWDLNIYASCGTAYVPKVSLVKDSVTIIQQDTATRHATCGCYYDVTVSFSGWAAGTYRVFVYRTTRVSNYKDTTYVGSLSFTISGTSPQPPTTNVNSGACHEFPIVSVKELPFLNSYTLLANYPNPFNPSTTIRYSIPHADIVKLEVFDELGRLTAQLVNEKKEAGVHEEKFDGTRLGSGVYYCRLVAGTNVLTSKLILLK